MKSVALSRSGMPQKQSLRIFGADGSENQKLEIANGDAIRLSYTISAYSTAAVGPGVTLDLRYVQVLKKASAPTAAGFGFSCETIPFETQAGR